MPSDGAQVWAGYRELDAVLAREPGGHATSPAWMEFLERWLLGGKVRAVVRKGRQGGGSEVLGHRLPVAVVLFGRYVTPPGTRMRVVFASQRQLEAADKLHGVEHVLKALHVPHSRSGDTIELRDRPVVFQSFPCSESAVRGPSAVYALEDELAIWRDGGGVNPAHRVDAAILPSGVTQENFRIASISSPIGSEDFHAVLFERGETAHQCVGWGPSWYWNPSISEARTHELQPDEIAWRREFAALPQGALSAAFDPDAVRFAFEPRVRDTIVGSPVVALDPAGRGQDTYAICGVGWAMPMVDPDAGYEQEPLYHPDGSLSSAVLIHRDRRVHVEPPKPLLCAWNFRSIDAAFRRHLEIDEIADTIAELAREIGAPRAVTDQSEAFSLVSLLGRRGLPTSVYSFGGKNGARVISRFRQLLNARAVFIEAGASVMQQFLQFEERVTANGISFQQRGRDASGGHLDDVSAVLVGVRADLEGHLSESPAGGRRGLVAHHADGSVSYHGGAQPPHGGG